MTAPVRVDRLTTPLVIGVTYLVPTVEAQWFAKTAVWPVIGPEHEDTEFFGFRTRHYHVDARFLSKWPITARYGEHVDTLSSPLHGRGEHEIPTPVWRRRKCHRIDAVGTGWRSPILQKMFDHFAGQQCAHGKGGWICPHKRASLGSVLPLDGIITCPLHGLRIDAATGIVTGGAP